MSNSAYPYPDRPRNRFLEWYWERSSWALREEIHADVRELRAVLRAHEEHLKADQAAEPGNEDLSAETRELIRGIADELDRAEGAIDLPGHRRGATGSHLTAARLHFNTAYALWLRLIADALHPHLPALLTVVEDHLEPPDKRRIAVQQIARDVHSGKERLDPDRARTVIEAVGAAHDAALREKLRAASFVRILVWMIVIMFVAAVTAAALAAAWPEAVPLCFNPQAFRGAGKSPEGRFKVVCPTNAAPGDFLVNGLDAVTRRTARRMDYFVVEIVGVVAAGIAATTALRKMHGTATAFPIPVALAVLKLPTGALTAVLGLLLMSGAFVPGLSALDSAAQIIGWAAVFGYAQEVFTNYVDRRGEAVLRAVHQSTDPMYPAGTLAPAVPSGGPSSASSGPQAS